MEFWCVLPAANVPCVCWSHNKFLSISVFVSLFFEIPLNLLTLRSSTVFFLPERRRLFSCCSFSTTFFIAAIVLSSSATDFLDLYWKWCCTTLYHTYPHQTQRNQKLSSVPLRYTGCDSYISCPSQLNYIEYNKWKAFFFHFISPQSKLSPQNFVLKHPQWVSAAT